MLYAVVGSNASAQSLVEQLSAVLKTLTVSPAATCLLSGVVSMSPTVKFQQPTATLPYLLGLQENPAPSGTFSGQPLAVAALGSIDGDSASSPTGLATVSGTYRGNHCFDALRLDMNVDVALNGGATIKTTGRLDIHGMAAIPAVGQFTVTGDPIPLPALVTGDGVRNGIQGGGCLYDFPAIRFVTSFVTPFSDPMQIEKGVPLDSGGAVATVAVDDAGMIDVVALASAAPDEARAAAVRGRPVVVARGRRRVTQLGRYDVKLHPTPAGRSLLGQRSPVKTVLRATFRPDGGDPVVDTARLTLRRRHRRRRG